MDSFVEKKAVQAVIGLALIGLMWYLVLSGTLISDQMWLVFTVVVAFYFGVGAKRGESMGFMAGLADEDDDDVWWQLPAAFWDNLVQTMVGLSVVALIIYLAAMGLPIRGELWSLLAMVIGFYFGVEVKKVQIAHSRG